MSETATQLLEQLLKLSEADRLLLADQLWESLNADKQEELIDEATNDSDFQTELARRFESITNGQAELAPWEAARKAIQTELDRRKTARQQENHE